VASYHASDDWPYRPQIYWRADTISLDGVIGSMSLLASVQTDLLDTYPRMTAGSQFAASEVFLITGADAPGVGKRAVSGDCIIEPTAGICCFLQRLENTRISYAEFMPASDFQRLELSNSSRHAYRASWRLFAEFLEKGVIRRARLHGAFLRREDDMEIAAACCEAIENQSLPLTA
jgi:hypothetical protein